MTLLAKMDRLVYATRLDRVIFMKLQPRSFRWVPLFVIAALIGSYALMARTASLPGRSFIVGSLFFYGAFVVAAFLRAFGPRFSAPLDERELIAKARAYAISGIFLTSFAMLGCFYIASAKVLGLWQPHAVTDWVNLGMGIQAAGLLLPTLIASWLEPRPVADREVT